jgi:hypothetical protein
MEVQPVLLILELVVLVDWGIHVPRTIHGDFLAMPCESICLASIDFRALYLEMVLVYVKSFLYPSSLTNYFLASITVFIIALHSHIIFPSAWLQKNINVRNDGHCEFEIMAKGPNTFIQRPSSYVQTSQDACLPYTSLSRVLSPIPLSWKFLLSNAPLLRPLSPWHLHLPIPLFVTSLFLTLNRKWTRL